MNQSNLIQSNSLLARCPSLSLDEFCRCSKAGMAQLQFLDISGTIHAPFLSLSFPLLRQQAQDFAVMRI